MKKNIFGMLMMCAAGAALAAQTTPVPDVAPAAKGWQVVINVPQQRLFLYRDGKLDTVYPVAVGKAVTQTTLGEHKIGAKAFNPTWHIPKSIQKELNNGQTSVPPGPKNPLGPVFVRLGDPKLGLGIHGTNNPSSVPGVRSHGCVRMKSPDALQFAKTITTGSPATVSYELAALNVDEAGQLWLAVFSDPYNRKSLKTETLKKSIAAWGKTGGKTIRNAAVEQALKARNGKPVCISCSGKGKFVIKGDLQSVAWNSGSAALTKPKAAASVPVPVKDTVLPDGSEVEVDVGERPGKAVAEPKSVRPVAAQASAPVKPTSVFERNGNAVEKILNMDADITPTSVF